MMLRAIRAGLLAACGVALAVLALLWAARLEPDGRIARAMHALSVPAPGPIGAGPLATGSPSAGPQPLPSIAIGGDFTLTDAAGRIVHPSSYAGRFLLVYFGYTSCPDICPTTLQAMADALRQIGPLADRVQPLFITVDPQRDSAPVIGRYTALFDKRIVGLTGTPAQVTAAESAYHVYAARVDQPGAGANGYLMDHTSFVYLMRPDGALQAMFGRDATAHAMASALTAALANQPH